MKSGTRALGVADSTGEKQGTLAGCVVRADSVVDGMAFGPITVGSVDATAGIIQIIEELDRDDIQYLLIAGIAPAWFNVIDLEAINRTTELPALSISFEGSEGLSESISDAFDGRERERRLAIYEKLPARHRVDIPDGEVFVRSVGIEPEEATEVVEGFTPAGGRPEPLRVAKIAARAAESYR